MRKFVYILLLISMIFSRNILISAEINEESSDFVLEEVSPESIGFESERELPNPYTLYIMNVITHISDRGDGKIYMGTEIYCTYDMKEITARFQLQQLIDDTWVNVARHVSSAENTDYLIVFVSVAYPPSGTYRVKVTAVVEDYNGYTELTVGYSPDIYFVSDHT